MQPSIDMMLTNIRFAARDTNLYTFEPAEGGSLPPAHPGAHIGLHLGNGMERQYSLCVSDPNPTSYTVGIKCGAASRGGSRWIHEHMRVGMLLKIDAPRNNFPLREDATKTVLFAGGIGITPIYCMMNHLETRGRNFDLYYSCRSRRDAAFLRELIGRPNVHMHFDEETQGRVLPLGDIIAAIPIGADLYCCGPTAMLATFEAAATAASHPAANIHVEYFSQKHEAATAGGYTVKLARSNREYEIPGGQSILRILLDDGIEVSHSCEQGICGACETKVLEGIPDHRDAILTDTERAENRTMMICCSGSKTQRLVLDI